jgi:hypothetical protein
MNRLPRRASGLPLPLRGRLAATAPGGAEQPATCLIRPRLPILRGATTIRKAVPPPCLADLDPSWHRFHSRFAALFTVLDRPWKWLLLVLILIVLAALLF